MQQEIVGGAGVSEDENMPIAWRWRIEYAPFCGRIIDRPTVRIVPGWLEPVAREEIDIARSARLDQQLQNALRNADAVELGTTNDDRPTDGLSHSDRNEREDRHRDADFRGAGGLTHHRDRGDGIEVGLSGHHVQIPIRSGVGSDRGENQPGTIGSHPPTDQESEFIEGVVGPDELDLCGGESSCEKVCRDRLRRDLIAPFTPFGLVPRADPDLFKSSPEVQSARTVAEMRGVANRDR